jgi:hypothetical protein
MVRYMSLEEQVDADFSRARRRAFLRRISARLRKRPVPDRLLCFGEVSRKLGVAGGVRRGRRTVRLTDIVGSVSRCSEFDGAFLPLREHARTKWERMDRAFVRGEELPRVSLYKVGSSYFVEDGNHRVSVYRYQGVEFIDAEVTEFRASLPGDRKDDGRPIHHPSSGVSDANVADRFGLGRFHGEPLDPRPRRARRAGAGPEVSRHPRLAVGVNLPSRRVMENAGLKCVRTFHPRWEDPLPGRSTARSSTRSLRTTGSGGKRVAPADAGPPGGTGDAPSGSSTA